MSFNEFYSFDRFNVRSKKIGSIISNNLSSKAISFDEINFHNENLLETSKTSPQGRTARSFAANNDLINLLYKPTFLENIKL